MERFTVKTIILPALAAALLLSACGGDRGQAPEPFRLLAPTAEAPAVSTGTIRSGDTWASAMRAAPAAEVNQAARALRKGGVVCPRPGDLYAAAYSTSGALSAFALARGEEIYSLERSSGSFVFSRKPLPAVYTVREASGTLESSLWEAMSASGLPPALIMEYADVFAWEIDFLTEPRKGDRFAVVWEEGVTALGRKTGLKVKAAAYSGEQAGEARGYLRGAHYYDEKGRSLRRAFLRAPLSYRRISSYFCRARFHPILRRYRAHNGIDYAAPSGTPVSAVADGTVSFKGWKGGYGNFIELRHANGCVTGYGHLRGYARGLRQGQRVAQGQVIGYVGMTGLATGPHLDFSLKINGKFTDFLKFRPPSVSSLGGAELKEFSAAAAPLGEKLERLLGRTGKK